MPSPSLYFGPFELQTAQRRLLRDGQPLPLRARAFDLLRTLAERAGSLVTKAELLDEVWPGLVVEPNNIATQMTSLRKLLGDDVIATVPGIGYRFAAPLRPAPAGTAGAGPAGAVLQAPAASPAAPAPGLYGREVDLARLQQGLQQGGCVTLVGPGGVGKTALAKALASACAGGKKFWVDLAPLGIGEAVLPTLCRALAVSLPASEPEQRAALAAALARGADAPPLLVLDNAEHVLESTAEAVRLLCDAVPSLALLVTSQAPLRLAGEQVQLLEPLALPAAGLSDDATFANASVALLVARVRSSDHRFALDVRSAPLLRRLCELLDGLPLALEMAAARVPLLGLQGVLDALGQRFALLTRGARDAPSRHKTLRAALEWSHALLAPAEQQLFRRLGVYASGFTPDLAVAVGSAGEGDDRWALVESLAVLVDRSLVASQHTDPPRYRLLETLRGYALESLAAAEEGDSVRRRQVAALTALLAPDGLDAPRASAPPAAVAELPNVPEALAWARRHDAPAAVKLALAASGVATWTPWIGEAVQWIVSCEPLLGADVPLPLQAAWWREMARFQTFVRGARTVEAASRAAALERELGNPNGLFWSLIPLLRSRALDAADFEACQAEAQALLDRHPEWPLRNRVVFSGSLAMEYRRRGDFKTAWAHQQAEAELADAAGLHDLADNALCNLAATLVGLDRYGDALDLATSLLVRIGASQSPVGAHARVQRVYALIGLGRLAEAAQQAREAMAWCRRFDVLDGWQVLALLEARQGRAALAAQLLGHYRQALVQRGAELPADEHAPWRLAQQLALETLDEATLEGLMARGARLDGAAAAALMFGEAPSSLHDTASGATPAPAAVQNP